MKTRVLFLIGLMVLVPASIITADDVAKSQPIDSVEAGVPDTVVTQMADQVVIYYLHMNRRCMTCEKLEAYSGEAVTSGFEDQLKDSSIIWRIVNFEEEGNEHFAKEYQLYSQSLIVSRLHDGKEAKWKNLDKIWKLVHNKDKFIAYVQTEIKEFLNPAKEE